MNKDRKLYVFLGFIVLVIFAVIILFAMGTIEQKFDSSTMDIFSKISESSVYTLFGILIVNLFITSLSKKLKEKSQTVTICLVYLLLALTIISVDVYIIVWIISLALTLSLLLISIFDIMSKTHK